MTSNWPEIDFSDKEFWLLSENRIFLTTTTENNSNKVNIAQKQIENRV